MGTTWILVAAVAAVIVIATLVTAGLRRRGASARDERRRREAKDRRQDELLSVEVARQAAEARLRAAHAQREDAMGGAGRGDHPDERVTDSGQAGS